MNLNKIINNLVNAAIISKAEDSLEKHQECLSAAVSDLIKAGAPVSEIARTAYVCGHAHSAKELMED